MHAILLMCCPKANTQGTRVIGVHLGSIVVGPSSGYGGLGWRTEGPTALPSDLDGRYNGKLPEAWQNL